MTTLYYIITIHEHEKFVNMTKKILADAKKYSFHHESLKAFTTVIMVGYLQNLNESKEYYYVLNHQGWAIIHQAPDLVEIMYIFVYPEHRRNGFFTQLLTLIKRQQKEICVCTRESIMLRALVAKGFQLKGHSLCGTELQYTLKPN